MKKILIIFLIAFALFGLSINDVHAYSASDTVLIDVNDWDESSRYILSESALQTLASSSNTEAALISDLNDYFQANGVYAYDHTNSIDFPNYVFSGGTINFRQSNYPSDTYYLQIGWNTTYQYYLNYVGTPPITTVSVDILMPEVETANPGFTVYAFTASETTHNLPLGLDLNKIEIYADGDLIYSFGTIINTDYAVRSNVDTTLIIDEENLINDSAFFSTTNALDNYIGQSFVIIFSEDPDSFTAWGFDENFVLSGNENLLSEVDLDRTTIIRNGVIKYTNGVPETGVTAQVDSEYRLALFDNDADILYIFANGSIELVAAGVVVIEAAETEEGPDTTGWTQDGTYFTLDEPLPSAGQTITVTSPFGNPLEYRLVVSGTVIQDWTTAPSTLDLTMRVEMVGVGDFNHFLDIEGENYEDTFGPYLDPINYAGFEIRTSGLETPPSGWFENSGYWYAEDPTPSAGETITLTSPFGTPIQYRLKNGETIVKNWTDAPSTIELTLRVEFIALGDFNFYIDIVGVEYTDTLGPYMDPIVYINGFEVRTDEPFIDASPVIEGQQYVTVSYHQPVTEAAIRSNLYAWDEVDGDLSDSIELVSDDYTANKSEVGTYAIVYSVTDSSDNTAELTVYVVVIDQIAPVFHFGSDTVYQSYKVIRAFAVSTVNDAHDGPVPVVEVENTYTPNWNLVGEYHITYTATDASGNTATMTRTIIVVDDVPPTITGPAIITKSYNTVLTTGQIMAQLSASDEIDGDVTESFTVISSTYAGKSSIPGTYSILFRAVDESGNTSQRTVTVIVTDNIPPIWYATDNFLITLDQAVQLSTNQIISTLQLSGFITPSQAQNLYVVTDEYQQTTDIGTYDLVFGITGETETITVTLVVYNLSLEEPGIYTITFNSNGGSFVPSVSTDGTPITAPTAPTRTGYVFAGWYTTEELTTLYNFSNEVTADLTLYAKWVVSGGTVTPPPASVELSGIQIAGIVAAVVIVLAMIGAMISPKYTRRGRRR